MSDELVLFDERACDNGRRIGVATLNTPKALNSLSLDMIDLLFERLLQWRDDAGIAAVWLEGAGDRAFCAGGDIVRLYETAKAQPGEVPAYAEVFLLANTGSTT